MRLHKSLAVIATIGAILAGHAAPAQEPLKVVATFSILADFVHNVGGDRVTVHALVGANGDVHVYQPTPADAKLVAGANVVVVNGLGYEGWLDRLIRASATKLKPVVASEGIKPRRSSGHGHGDGHSHGQFDPHAWQSVANAKIYVANIRNALIAADPAGKAAYEANAAAYLAKLDALEREVREVAARIPPERRRIITNHDSFGYFAEAYGLEMLAAQGVSTETQPSAKELAALIRQIRARKIGGVFMENITDPRLIERIAKETGARIGGVLYSDALTRPDGPAPTYIDLIRHNIRMLASALVG
ncbi:MAG TPA: zinc ABC transporter substrate-binding protein [Xanthobacteraceae bacterium]|nr:zinc ABC transporter substrate-binding protein [Xanthobacteraceae bacterium]